MKKKYVLLILLLALNAIAWNETIYTAYDLTINGTLDVTELDADVEFFNDSDTDVANGDDGYSVQIHRKAAEGDGVLDMYIGAGEDALIDFDGDADNYLMFESNDSNIYFDTTAGAIVFGLSGDSTMQVGSATMGPDNPALQHYGYITSNDDATAKDERYIQWQVEDTNDTFTLSRGSTHVTALEIDGMDLTVGEFASDVDNMENGPIFRVQRNAQEGDSWVSIYQDAQNVSTIAAAGTLYINSGGTEIALQQSGMTGISYGSPYMASGRNPYLRHYGYITNGADERYVQWKVDDTDDRFVLSTPSTTYVTAFETQMDIIPSENDTLDLGYDDTNEWANLWAVLVNGSDYAFENKYRLLESEKYDGYPEGIAIGNEGFTKGEVEDKMPKGMKPLLVVTEDFIEYKGIRITAEKLKELVE